MVVEERVLDGFIKIFKRCFGNYLFLCVFRCLEVVFMLCFNCLINVRL